ncbi:MAG: hypothetical protein R2800_04810 [Flavipsychrobacter sp.]
MKLFLYTLILFVGISTYAQEFEVPSIEILEIEPPKKGASMEYKFPDTVTHILENKMSQHDGYWFIEMYVLTDDTVRLALYKLNTKKPKDCSGDMGIIFSSTNRHFKYGNREMPIILSSDHRFAFPSFAMTDGYVIKFVARKWYSDATIIHAGYYY